MEDVKTAGNRFWKALGDAAPGKSTLLAAAVAASPLYGDKIGEFYKIIGAVANQPVNEILARLQTAIQTPPASSQLTASNTNTLQLPPVQVHTTTTTEVVPNAAILLQVQQWLASQPKDKTCGELSRELHSWLINTRKAANPATATTSSTTTN